MSIQVVIQKAAKLIIQLLSSFYQKQIILTSISKTSIDNSNKPNGYNIFYSIKYAINDFVTYEPFQTQELNQKFHIIIKTILMSLRSLDNNNQEYNLCLLVLCKLLINGANSSISFHFLKRGYMIAMKYVIYSLSHDSTPVKMIINWNDYHQLIQLINFRLASYTFMQWFNAKTVKGVAENILNAFILLVKPILIAHTLNANIHSNINNSIIEIQTSSVIYHTIAGLQVDYTKLYRNQLWLDIPLSMEFIQAFGYYCDVWYNEDLIVIIFECSLEFPELNKGESIEMSDMSYQTYNCELISLEHQYMNKFVEMLRESHVTLVACQKRVHPYLERKLLSNGILCISRISVRFIGALQRLSGARQLGAIPSICTSSNSSINSIDSSIDELPMLLLDMSCLGYLHSIRKENIFGKQFIIACGYSDENINSNQDIYDVLYKRLELKFINQYELHLKKILNGYIDRYKPCISIIITSPSETLVQQLKNSFEESLNYLLTMLQRSFHATSIAHTNVIQLLPGAGCWQAYAATYLQNTSSISKTNQHINNNKHMNLNTKSIESAVHIYTKCFFDIANIIALGNMNYYVNNEDASQSNEFIFPSYQTDTATNKEPLYFKSISGEEIVVKLYSQDLICNYQLVSGSSLDCYETNIQAIKIATKLCCSLLELDDVIFVK